MPNRNGKIHSQRWQVRVELGKGGDGDLRPFAGAPSPINMVLLLVAQGTADTVNPPGCSAQFYGRENGSNGTLTWLVPGQLVPYSGANTSEACPSAPRTLSTGALLHELGRPDPC